MRTLAQVIQTGRADHRWSVDELATRSAVPAETIWRLIATPGQCLLIDDSTICALAAALDLPPEVLTSAARSDLRDGT